MPESTPRDVSLWPRKATWAVLGVAAILRLLRVPLRWDEWTWQYLAYDARTWEALSDSRFLEAISTFSGLHPPLFPILHAIEELLLPAPGLVLLASACASMGAVVIALKIHPMVGLLVATSPIQVAYAAEANNYPLMCIAIAGILWAREQVSTGLPAAWLGIAGVLGAWTHLLAGWVAVVVATTVGKRHATLVLGILAVGTGMLWEPIFLLLTEPGSWRQPPVRVLLMAKSFLVRFGPGALLLVPLFIRGARVRRDIALVWTATLGLIWGLQAIGIAAPHQFPYYLALGIPGAMLVAAGTTTRRAQHWILLITTLQAVWLLGLNGRALVGVITDQSQTRAIDIALSEATDGDGIYLLSPPRLEDDDKSAHSKVLHRISPWQTLPAASPYAMDYLDHHHGQPRGAQGLTLYVNDHPRDALDLAVAAHTILFLVVYEHREDPRYTTDLAKRFGSEPERIGDDLIWRLHKPDSSDTP